MITKAELTEARDAAHKALSDALRPLGYEVRPTKGTYGNVGTMTFEINTIDASGKAKTSDEIAYDAYHAAFGLPGDGIGQKFSANGHTYTVTGLAPSSRRFPVLTSREDGKVYKFPADAVIAKLKAAKAA